MPKARVLSAVSTAPVSVLASCANAGTATKTAALATVQKNLRMWEFLLLYLLHQPAPARVAGRPRLQEINRARLELLQCGDKRYADFGDCRTEERRVGKE